jgi:anti-sigma regulatory factor (Ser/Thr protein kinase)
MPERYSLTVDSRLERLSEIADFVAQATHNFGMDDKQTYDVQMAIDEACSNVIQHAYGGKPNGSIDIVIEKRNKDFIVTIRDYGKPFDPKTVARPKTNVPLSERNIGGLGLFFMYKLMDRVEFDFSSRQGNFLTMVKKIKK